MIEMVGVACLVFKYAATAICTGVWGCSPHVFLRNVLILRMRIL